MSSMPWQSYDSYCQMLKHIVSEQKNLSFIMNIVTFNTLSINFSYYGEFHSFWIGCLSNIHLYTRAC